MSPEFHLNFSHLLDENPGGAVAVRFFASPSSMLRYKGAAHFRQRIILATLSGRAVRIDDIRSGEEQVGLRDYEACFLRLLEKVVNGCEIVINETGTAMRYRPGIIVGGAGHVHDCGTSRAIIQLLKMFHPNVTPPF